MNKQETIFRRPRLRSGIQAISLSVVLFCGVGSDCVALSGDDKLKIAAGATAVAGLWTCWTHLSNKNAILRAENLWDECHAFVGKQGDCLGGDLQRSIYQLESSPILKRKDDIVKVHRSLSKKMDWFWNRSNRMKDAYMHSKTLEKSLDAYLAVYNCSKQQLAAQKVFSLWQSFAKYDLSYSPDSEVIRGATLQNFSQHPLVKSQEISPLYHELCNAHSYCYEFADAHKKIIRLYNAQQQYFAAIREIQCYDEIVEKYQDFIQHMHQVFNKQDIVSCARQNSSGEFPLLSFVDRLKVDIDRLSAMRLNFAYVRLHGNVVLGFDNALRSVEQYLQDVKSLVMSSNYYHDEVRFYQEKIRLQEAQRRLAEEQRRLHANINNINHKINDLEYENWRLKEEIKNKQNK